MSNPLLQRVKANPHGRDFLVGDVHGQYDMLVAELRRVEFRRSVDRLFLVGDVIDRGPNSYKCLMLGYAPWAFPVLGNHELMMRAAIGEDASERMYVHWLTEGGMWYLIEDRKSEKPVLLDAISTWPYAIELEVGDKRLGIVHAEPPALWSDLDSAQRSNDQGVIDEICTKMTWSRTRISKKDASLVGGIDAVVFGHTIVESPVTLGNVHFIDTGASRSKGGKLTLVDARSFF